MSTRQKVVLAYSGGLDTSCCIRWLKDKDFRVICFVADIGQEKDFNYLKEKALKIGAEKVFVLDLKDEFVNDFVLPSLKANAIYEGKYFLSAALSRPLIAKYLVKIAKDQNAKYIAHGCTGKGNDQVRFEVSIAILDPKLEIIAPLREWEFKSREEEIEYAKKFGIPVEVTKEKPYSIDKNLWGVSIECGHLEDIEKEPYSDVYQITKDPKDSPEKPFHLEIYFERGTPKRINGKSYSLKDLISKLNDIGSFYGIGRSDLIENRLIGIKSREIYEAPAAQILYIAHKELESLVLDRELLHFKEIISLKYSELIYYGLWYSPLKSALDGFVEDTQKNVTGKITLKLYKGNCFIASRSSKFSLYKKELATYTKKDKFNQKLAEGFIKIWGMPYKKI
jgi:argininosuccinate synthase